MYAIPVTPSTAKLMWDNETRKVDEYNELPAILKNSPHSVDHHHGSDSESSGPPTSTSTTVATEPYATPRVNTEDVSNRPNTSSTLPFSTGGIDEFSDSDLTEIDDEVPSVAFNPSSIPNATAGNPSDDGNSGLIDSDHFITDTSNIARRSTRRRHPTHRQSLWDEGVSSDVKEHPRRRHSLPAPTKPSAISTTSPCPITKPQLPRQQVAKTRPKAKLVFKSGFAERRTSTRLQNAMTKEISFNEYSDNHPDYENNSMTVRSSSSSSTSEMAAQIVLPKLETEDKDVVEPDSWKAGWTKSDSWTRESPKAEFLPEENTLSTKRKIIPSRSSHRSQRIGMPVHRKSYSKLTMSRRVECPKGCGKTFGRAHDAYRHADQTMGCGGGQKPFVCTKCGNHFSRKDALKRHQGYEDGKRSAPQRCSAGRR